MIEVSSRSSRASVMCMRFHVMFAIRFEISVWHADRLITLL